MEKEIPTIDKQILYYSLWRELRATIITLDKQGIQSLDLPVLLEFMHQIELRISHHGDFNLPES